MADLRIRSPLEFKEMLAGLTDTDGGIFDTFKDVLLFAACLGFQRGKRKRFSKSGGEIRQSVFSSEFNKTVLNALAVAETTNPAIMSDEMEKDRLQIFEEFACGGLEILKNEFWDPEPEADWETLLADLICQEQDSESVLRDITGAAD